MHEKTTVIAQYCWNLAWVFYDCSLCSSKLKKVELGQSCSTILYDVCFIPSYLPLFEMLTFFGIKRPVL